MWGATVVGPDDAAAEAFVGTYQPRHVAAVRATAALMDGYVEAFLRANGQTPQGASLDPGDYLRPRGIPVAEELMRPVIETRTALSEGKPWSEAFDQGRNRLANIAATDYQQTYRTAFRDRASREPSIGGYRRVLRGPENCVMCVVASTQRYHTDRLNPIHPGCDCGVEAIMGADPGQVVDVPRLEEAKRVIRDEGLAYTDRQALRNAKLMVDNDALDAVTEVPHGELGPLLAISRHRATTPADL